MSADRKGSAKKDVRVNGDTSVRSSPYICAHASKALRVRSSTSKDRHCKVNTPKGHRDRRVRLAVSTAIQLYSLQHRLGLQQPSKVLDWLISKSKSAIDGLPIPSSISNLNCRACNTIQNNGATVVDVISTSREANGVSHSVPKILPFRTEKENETKFHNGQTNGEEMNVGTMNVLRLSMLQNRTEASALVPICSERKRLQPSVLVKKGNTQEGIALTSPFQEQEGVAMTSPFQQQSGCFDVRRSSADNSNANLAPFYSLHMPRHEAQFGRDQEIMRAASSTATLLPLVFCSNSFDSSRHDGKTNNFSQECKKLLTSSLQDNDSIYAEEPLRLSGNINSYINTIMPSLTPNPIRESIASWSTTVITEVQEGGGGNGIYFERCH